jgi:ABC-type multidrug transport system fused ATPase/permease subunit
VKSWFNKTGEDSTLIACAKLLPKSDRRKLILVSILQLLLSFVDLIAVGIIGVLGALTVRGINSQEPGDRVSAILDFLHLSNFSFQETVAILGLLAGLLLVSRTLASVFLTRKTLFFLARRGAFLSSLLVSKLLTQSILVIQQRTSQLTVYSLTTGVEAIVLSILGTLVIMVSDVTILLVMAVGLFVVDPRTAVGAIVMFGLVGYVSYQLMHKRAKALGELNSRLQVESQEKIIEVLTSYRELTVSNRKGYYANVISNIRQNVSSANAEMVFMPNISKYVFESAVVLGAIVVSGIQFLLNDASRAVGTLSIFLAAGMRIAPAALRIQQGAIGIKTSIGAAKPTLHLIDQLNNVTPLTDSKASLDLLHEGFIPQIEIRNSSLTYPENGEPSVRDISLTVPEGSTLAFVGPSGAGKTTIIDILLGVLEPQIGEVLISGKKPADALRIWPGAISYVPQDIAIASGTIRENVALGYPPEMVIDELVVNALKVAGLFTFVQSLKNGVDTVVGERGTKISGGQRQRLGIARAMFTKPALLVLDEATSALDGETELQVSDAIRGLRGSTTVVLIAHRLSTVRDADKVVYMAEGRIVASGTFEEVRTRVPDFDRQAKLMGL